MLNVMCWFNVRHVLVYVYELRMYCVELNVSKSVYELRMYSATIKLSKLVLKNWSVV